MYKLGGKKEKNIKFVDLFCGIGGFHYAFTNNIKNAECILASEIEKNAIENYSINFKIPKDKIIDILDIKPETIKPNAIFAGFPCQSFSNAGFKKGFLDEKRGNLFFDVMNIFQISKPEIGLLENVKHLTSHNNGETWKRILKEINDIGYITLEKPLILSPTNFGIPQNRVRVFIPLVRKDLTNSGYLEEVEIPNITIKDYKDYILPEYNKKYELNKEEHSILKAWENFVTYFQNKKIYKNIPVIWLDKLRDVGNYPDDCQPWKKIYLERMWSFYEENKLFIDSWMEKSKTKDWKNKRDRKLEWHAGPMTKFKDTIIQFRQSGIRCKSPKTLQTLVAMVQIPIIYQKNKWRKLMPIEISDFQSFPKNYIRSDSDFQSYKQFGNSINVEVAEWVIKNYLMKYLEEVE